MRLSKTKVYRIKLFVVGIALLLIVVTGVIVLKYENLLPSFASLHSKPEIKLPAPVFEGKVSVEQALKERRSSRQYKNEPLNLEQLSQLLWAAQGVTSNSGFRTSPSAGALYPLKLYVVSGNVQGLGAGIYEYLPESQALVLLQEGDKRKELAASAKGQEELLQGAFVLVLTGNYQKEVAKYSKLGERFVHMEAGHAAQNILLEAVSLGVGTVNIGNFNAEVVQRLLNLPKFEDPLYLLPVGKL